MVDADLRLLDHLGVERLHATMGGSTGGLMALSLATRYPDRVDIVVPVAAGLGVTSLQVVHNFEQITAITSDPAFAGGEYGAEPPAAGLALARMIGHKTFVSLSAMRTRAREEIVEGAVQGYRLRHPLESYMRHQGTKFVARFDANSYLRIMEAWQSVDLLAEAGAEDWDSLFGRCRRQRWVQFSIDSDVCFYPEEQAALAAALSAAGVPNRVVEVASDRGHDAFLVETDRFADALRATLEDDW
jgi:homoserine O-acetyltransferase